MNYNLAKILFEEDFWYSTLTSLIIAVSSSILSLLLAACMAIVAFYLKFKLLKPTLIPWVLFVSNINLLISPFIIVTAIFIAFKNIKDIDSIAKYIVILANSFMVLPYMVSIILPIIISIPRQEIYLCETLDIKGVSFIKRILWPKIKKSISYALALAVVMSMGDYGVIAIFGSDKLSTLPSYLYGKMSSYRVNDASSIALILLVLSILIFAIIEKLFNKKNAYIRSGKI
jgi:thiamine transport system permease protein